MHLPKIFLCVWPAVTGLAEGEAASRSALVTTVVQDSDDHEYTPHWGLRDDKVSSINISLWWGVGGGKLMCFLSVAPHGELLKNLASGGDLIQHNFLLGRSPDLQ